MFAGQPSRVATSRARVYNRIEDAPGRARTAPPQCLLTGGGNFDTGTVSAKSEPADTPARNLHCSDPAIQSTSPRWRAGLKLFSYNLTQNVFFARQVCHQALELGVLVTQQSEFSFVADRDHCLRRGATKNTSLWTCPVSVDSF
jgi:hypothetical protein